MKVCLVGFTPDQAGEEALTLGRSLTMGTHLTLIVCTVIPEAWGHPSLASVDQEYSNFLTEYAQEALTKARALLKDVDGVRYIKYIARSATIGLTEAAKQENADIIILGSSHYQGTRGRLSLGSMSSEIMHLSELPVAIAPHGYSTDTVVPMSRITCAYSGLEAASGTVLEALDLATSLGVPLRLTSFAVRDRQMYPSLAGYNSERLVETAWREQAQASLERVLKQLPASEVAIEISVAEGENWDKALEQLDWKDGELLALGSSRMGVIARVFMGSNANKIFRASPVPVMVLPRSS